MSATTAERHVSLYTILVDDSEIDADLSRRIREVRIQNYLRLPDMCTLAASFPKGEAGQGEPIDQSPFEIGSLLEVRLGAREDLTTSTVFKGDIVTLEPRWGAGGVELLVRAHDHSHVLMRSRKVRTFQNQTSSDIVSKLLTEGGFQAQCDPSGEPHEFVQQNNETDWELIWRLADRSGLELIIDGQTASLRKPSAENAIELEWPTSLRSFNPRVTAIQQVDEVTLRAQDPKTKQAIDVSVSTPQQIAQIGVDRADRRGCVLCGQDAHRDGTGQEPGGRHVRRPGEARPTGQRLRRDRGLDLGRPEDQGRRERQDQRRRRAVRRHRTRHTSCPHHSAAEAPTRRSFSNLPINTLLAATGSGTGGGHPSSAASSCLAS